ncbi:helix-turn-helix domain-containing protein [Sneathiella aquimaris]|uniref:helix-turn-helix domain-containing protein n=1 Tax=Sneathiella aquimaris TaxID=2599305 RepID=UPI00146B2203|nr:helix-turn-helix transcriptional regulator [Sneathiella aquimaris]
MPHHPVDVHVGSRVRLRRTLLGISQEKLGRELGLTFQQIQKYEKGANRIGSSRLYEISQILDAPPAFFFDDMPQENASSFSTLQEEETAFEHQHLSKRETLELVRAYYKIPDEDVRKRVFDLIKAVGGQNIDLDDL